jgi:hypothetical protein
MKIDLKEAIKAKTIQFETVLESGWTNAELMHIYKELKELKCQLVQAENFVDNKDLDLV